MTETDSRKNHSKKAKSARHYLLAVSPSVRSARAGLIVNIFIVVIIIIVRDLGLCRHVHVWVIALAGQHGQSVSQQREAFADVRVQVNVNALHVPLDVEYPLGVAEVVYG